MNVDNIHHV